MDNPEKLATLGAQDTGRRQTKQKKDATIRQQIQTLENHLNEGIPLQMSYYTYVFLFTYTYISPQQTRV